jgi:4'-phosphopantetheinyl transferase
MRTELDPLWTRPPTNPRLSNDEVHVWRARLDMPAASLESLCNLLSAHETSRAERFRFARDRQRYVAAHGLLRTILSYYVDVAPGQLDFCRNARGKPYLAPSYGSDAVRFNMSDSGDLALFAVTRGRKVGIDLERVRPLAEAQEIARAFFSAQEYAVFCTLAEDQKREAFFACWTRKEAYLKARGVGLFLPFDQFDVSLTPGRPAMLLATKGDAQEASRWSLCELRPGPGYAAALAVAGHGWQVKCWQFPHPT